MMKAMPRTGKVRPVMTPSYAVHMPSIGLIGAMHADLRPTEPGPFLSEGADGASHCPFEATTAATRKAGSALKTRNCP
jgi:hypothetical protein